MQARDIFRRTWVSYSGRLDAPLVERVLPLHVLLMVTTGSARNPDGTPRHDPFSVGYVIERAFRSALDALDATLLGEPLPPVSFPPNDEVWELITREPSEED